MDRAQYRSFYANRNRGQITVIFHFGHSIVVVVYCRLTLHDRAVVLPLSCHRHRRCCRKQSTLYLCVSFFY